MCPGFSNPDLLRELHRVTFSTPFIQGFSSLWPLVNLEQLEACVLYCPCAFEPVWPTRKAFLVVRSPSQTHCLTTRISTSQRDMISLTLI